MNAMHVAKSLRQGAVPGIFCLRDQTPHTFPGVSGIHTGSLTGRFVFTPRQKPLPLRPLRKLTNRTDAFCFKLFSFPDMANGSPPLPPILLSPLAIHGPA